MRITDRQLLAVSLLVTVAGLLALVAAQRLLAAEPLTPAELDAMPDDALVTVAGTIARVRTVRNTTFISLDSSCAIDVVLFGPADGALDIPIAEGQQVTVSGTKQTYKGKSEVIAERISMPATTVPATSAASQEEDG